MKKEEIYFLRQVGIVIDDEEVAVTTDNIDKLPSIYSFVEELDRIDNRRDWLKIYPLLKKTVYISCMMHYTIEVLRKKLISQKIYAEVFNKATKILKSIGSDKIIALTLLYEGPYYLHPEIYDVYKKAGYVKVVNKFIDVFGSYISKVEKEKDFSVIFGKEYEAYLDLYRNFMKLRENNEQGLSRVEKNTTL